MKRLGILALLLVGAAACARILGFKEPGPRPFEHRAHVLAGVTCVDCHAGIEEAGDNAPLHLPDKEDCVRCHEKPHDERACGNCHGMPYTAVETMQARRHLRFAHDTHQEVVQGNCMRCHRAVSTGGDRLRPGLGRCVSCHEHKDRFEVRDCSACHADLARDLRPPKSHLVHGPGFLRDHGAQASGASDLCGSCHRERFCASCHGASAPELPSRLSFDDPFAAGMHRAGFRSRHAEEARADPGLCSTCHSERSCVECHNRERVSAPAGVSRRSPHPPGWVGATRNEHGRAARLDPASCAACHSGPGEMLCVGCHRVGGVGGSPHPPGWQSKKSKRDVPCRACHLGGL